MATAMERHFGKLLKSKSGSRVVVTLRESGDYLISDTFSAYVLPANAVAQLPQLMVLKGHVGETFCFDGGSLVDTKTDVLMFWEGLEKSESVPLVFTPLVLAHPDTTFEARLLARGNGAAVLVERSRLDMLMHTRWDSLDSYTYNILASGAIRVQDKDTTLAYIMQLEEKGREGVTKWCKLFQPTAEKGEASDVSAA